MSNTTWTNANGYAATTPVERTFMRASDGAIFVMTGTNWSKDMRAIEPAELAAMGSQIDGLTDAIAAIQGD